MNSSNEAIFSCPWTGKEVFFIDQTWGHESQLFVRKMQNDVALRFVGVYHIDTALTWWGLNISIKNDMSPLQRKYYREGHIDLKVLDQSQRFVIRSNPDSIEGYMFARELLIAQREPTIVAPTYDELVALPWRKIA